MRLQLALNVPDLDEAVAFYGAMFDTAPHKIRPGYANFAIEQPPLKLVLFENPDADDSVNHLGVETLTAAEVVEAQSRLHDAGLDATSVDDTVCCFAEKTETWVSGPDGQRWEWYVVRGDVDPEPTDQDETVCCAPAPMPGSATGAPRPIDVQPAESGCC